MFYDGTFRGQYHLIRLSRRLSDPPLRFSTEGCWHLDISLSFHVYATTTRSTYKVY
jgi:hypothetical protein